MVTKKAIPWPINGWGAVVVVVPREGEKLMLLLLALQGLSIVGTANPLHLVLWVFVAFPGAQAWLSLSDLVLCFLLRF